MDNLKALQTIVNINKAFQPSSQLEVEQMKEESNPVNKEINYYKEEQQHELSPLFQLFGRYIEAEKSGNANFVFNDTEMKALMILKANIDSKYIPSLTGKDQKGNLIKGGGVLQQLGSSDPTTNKINVIKGEEPLYTYLERNVNTLSQISNALGTIIQNKGNVDQESGLTVLHSISDLVTNDKQGATKPLYGGQQALGDVLKKFGLTGLTPGFENFRNIQTGMGFMSQFIAPKIVSDLQNFKNKLNPYNNISGDLKTREFWMSLTDAQRQQYLQNMANKSAGEALVNLVHSIQMNFPQHETRQALYNSIPLLMTSMGLDWNEIKKYGVEKAENTYPKNKKENKGRNEEVSVKKEEIMPQSRFDVLLGHYIPQLQGEALKDFQRQLESWYKSGTITPKMKQEADYALTHKSLFPPRSGEEEEEIKFSPFSTAFKRTMGEESEQLKKLKYLINSINPIGAEDYTTFPPLVELPTITRQAPDGSFYTEPNPSYTGKYKNRL